MSRLFPIASGSSGNCTYIGSGSSGILIDVGISAKAVTTALNTASIAPESIRGIFVTHSHIDHISGLRVFADLYGIPVFASNKTAATLDNDPAHRPKDIHIIDDTVSVGDFLINRFDTSHDCAGSGGYTVTLQNGDKCGVCTDLGVVTDSVRRAITGCNALLFESNHDVTMLQNGGYPEHLKKRILGDMGHLSNVSCSKELTHLVENGTSRIVLGHLSRENNDPRIAKSTATSALMDSGMRENEDYLLFVAPPKNGKMIIF